MTQRQMSGMIPAMARYKTGGLPVSVDSLRRQIQLYPENGTSGYEPDINGTIRLQLPSTIGFLDTVNSYLSFRIKVKQNGTTPTANMEKEIRLDRHSTSWIRTFTIYSSTGSQLEHIQHYNLLVNLLTKMTSPHDYRSSIGKMIDNDGDRATRNAAMCHPAGSQFTSGFECSGILGGKTPYLPLAFFQGPLTVELTLDDFKSCFVGTDANATTKATYQIDNVVYNASVVSFGEGYNAAFEQQLRTQGVDISYDSYVTHNTTLNSSNLDLQISQNAKSVKTVYQVLRDKDSVQNQTVDSLSTYKSGNLEEVQWNLGGREMPEAPIKLKNDGITTLYTNNLNAMNMFRNYSLGSGISDETFASTEPGAVPLGVNSASGYQALPIKRVYGRWVCNSAKATSVAQLGEAVAQNAMVANQGKVTSISNMLMTIGSEDAGGTTRTTTYRVPTLTFIPDNARELGLIQPGLRCKMGLAATSYTALTGAEATVVTTNRSLKPHGSAAFATPAANSMNGAGTVPDPVGVADGFLMNVLTNKNGANGAERATAVAASANLGLDRFFKNQAGAAFADAPDSVTAPADGTAVQSRNNKREKSRQVIYPGSPSPVLFGHEGSAGGTATEKMACGIGIPFVDGNNHPIFSRSAMVYATGWVDIIPTDESFYISQNFETHAETSKLISGSDLTNATPLLCRLTYASSGKATSDFFDARVNGDVLTSFVHVDSVLRIEPDGTVISSH